MSQILTVFRFTFVDAARRKSFIISSAILFVLVTVLCLLPMLLGSSGDGEGSAAADMIASDAVQPASDAPADDALAGRANQCYYVDDANLIEGGLAALNAGFYDTAFTAGAASEIEAYRAEIAEDSSRALVVVREENGLPFVTVTTKDFLSWLSAEAVTNVLTARYVEDALAAAGFDAQAIRLSQIKLSYASDIAGSMNVSGYALGILLTMLIFFAVYFYGYGVAMSIATEKTSRVMETLIVSAKPSRILIGKALAMGCLGLIQFGSLILYTAICFKLFIPEGFLIAGMALSLSAFTVKSALLILAYFILGYALYAMMNAVCGATVSKAEDLNSAMMPVVFIALFSFYLGYFTAIAPIGDSAITKFAMYLPFSSPFVVPFKLLNGDVAALDVTISVALLLLGIVLVTWFSIKMYNASVLHYGNKLRLKDMLRAK